VRRAEPGGRRDYNRAISQLLAFWLYDDLSHDRKSKTLVWYFIRQSEGPLLYQLCPGSERVAQDSDILRCHKKGREAPLAAGAFHVDSFSGCGFITNGPLPEYPRYIFPAHQSRSADLFKTLLAAALEDVRVMSEALRGTFLPRYPKVEDRRPGGIQPVSSAFRRGLSRFFANRIELWTRAGSVAHLAPQITCFIMVGGISQ
jgi:hypothetical protein